ncbi:MAG: hypothetical protein K2J89_03195 [Clostridia bacterium]|nr:hypothetical protein [Clostridia bacterium]
MKKFKDVFDLSPPELTVCVGFMLFAIIISSIFTYISVVFIHEYTYVKEILQNGELVEAKFKEVGKQRCRDGKPGVDGYQYFAIYCYYDDENNYYEIHSAVEFYSPEEVIQYADKNPTKSIYIDGNGHSRSGNETLSKYIVKGVIVFMITVLFYVITSVDILQLFRRVKINKANNARKKEITQEDEQV